LSAVIIITTPTTTTPFDDEIIDKSKNDINFHQALAVGNIITILLSYYLKWDNESSKKAFNDLRDSKYHYKSL
jgi:hypothetical protein